ncbi:molybdopterin cofactor-binding domain-containing protein, partial [Oleiphilus sp. HI0061]
AKVKGESAYGIDVELQDLKYCVVERAPKYGGKLKSANIEVALQQKGVVSVLEVSRGIAVVANSYWQARKASKVLEAQWAFSEESVETSDAISNLYLDKLANDSGKSIRQDGDTAELLEADGHIEEFEFTAPFLAHATMEPMNAVARVSKGKAEVWAGTQAPDVAQVAVAKATNID